VEEYNEENKENLMRPRDVEVSTIQNNLIKLDESSLSTADDKGESFILFESSGVE
jgi:hypothetical protein